MGGWSCFVIMQRLRIAGKYGLFDCNKAGTGNWDQREKQPKDRKFERLHQAPASQSDKSKNLILEWRVR
jgi:hypothetical protein